MKAILLLVTLVATCTSAVVAQQQEKNTATQNPYYHEWKKELDEHGIQDNSFIIEEAYNQEYGIVQHISNFTYFWQTRSWAYSFTQEWPVDRAPKNQLSYTLLVAHSGLAGAGTGFGDVALNYRYQLVGDDEAKVAVTPRVSVLFPSGDSRFGRGAGGAGFQTNWAMSVVVNKQLTTHWNLGATVVPTGKDPAGDQSTTYAYNLGNSLVWTMHPRFNALLETFFVRGETVSSPRHTQWGDQLLLNPGVRWAYNFSSGLQIVPGIAVPLGVGPSAGSKGVFFYLSFEHPYRKIPRNEEKKKD